MTKGTKEGEKGGSGECHDSRKKKKNEEGKNEQEKRKNEDL